METDKNALEHGKDREENGRTAAFPDPFNPSALPDLFRHAVRLMARAHHHRGHARHAQERVLGMLAERGAMSQRLLMAELQVRSASLSELLTKLERQGYIVRARDGGDRRGMLAAITPEGEAALDGGEQEASPREENDVFAALSLEEKREMGRLLIKLVLALEEEGDAHHHRHGRRLGHPHCHGHHHAHGYHHDHGHHHAHDDGPGRSGPRGKGPGRGKDRE